MNGMKKISVHCSWDLEVDLLSEKQINLWVDTYPNQHKTPGTVNVGVFIEPPEVRRASGMGHPMIDRFDYVLTHDQNLLDLSNKCFLYEFGGCWTNDYAFGEKTFGVSTLIGGKAMTTGHVLRTNLYRRADEISTPKKIWISKNYPPRTPTGGNPILTGTKSSMFDTLFHICIENEKRHNWFTEKLIDCLYTKTVPVYYGCPNIGDWFDTRGFIIADNVSEIIESCNKLTPEIYQEMLPYIEENHNRAKLYSNVGINIKRSIESNIIPLIQ